MIKKRFGCLRIVLISGLVLIVLVAFWGVVNLPRKPKAGKPLVRVSPETTVITEPLDENGDPDYVEYLNRRQKEGVTPENNAAIPMIKAMGPKFKSWFYTKTVSEEYFRQLGIEPLGASGNYFTSIGSWIETSSSRTGDLSAEQWGDLLGEQHEFVTWNPWTGEQFPEQQQWLAKNREPLDLIRKATTRPRLYEPLLGKSVVEIDTPMTFSQRDIARSLSISAMNNLAGDRVDAAIEDTLAIRRLARLADQGPSITAGLVAVYIEEVGIGAEWRIVHSGKATKQQLRDYLDVSRQLQPLCHIPDRYDNFERFAALDAIFEIARGQSGAESGLVDSGGYPGIDWQQALLEVNSFYDLLVQATSRLSDDPMVQEPEATLSDKIDELDKELADPLLSLRLFVGGRAVKGRYIGKMIVALTIPATVPVYYAEKRIQTWQQLCLIVISVEAYKIDHGAYPEMLDQLAPEYFDELPLDPFVDKPFRYQRTDDGYLLYSLGKNKEDDGGVEDINDWENTDDLSASAPPPPVQDWNEIERKLRESWEEDSRESEEADLEQLDKPKAENSRQTDSLLSFYAQPIGDSVFFDAPTSSDAPTPIGLPLNESA